MIDESNNQMNNNSEIEEKDKEKAFVNEQGCFVCHGTGHWARECTSLPSIYLTDDAPKCYRCGGVGHFARFCPTSEKQFRNRERRASFPAVKPAADWGNYFGDLTGINFSIPQIPDQIFFVRPEYMDKPRANDQDDYYEMLSDCSSVDYIVEDVDSLSDIPDVVDTDDSLILQNQSKDHVNVIEVSIETPKS